MTHTPWFFILLIGFMVVYGALVVGAILFLRWKRKTRWPFKESDKLLRGPGESLRRELLKLDKSFISLFVATIAGALLVWPIFGWVIRHLGLTGWPALAGWALGMLLVIAVSVLRVIKLWTRRANYFLGWFGERIVAEKLQPLQLQGYRVFHDVPAEPGKKAFNLDHVVVGPTGVAVIEVKTRRKGNARSGRKDHEVIFNGTDLEWPSSRDTHSVPQALSEADWLQKWIFQCTGLRVSVKAIVTLPGWFVRETPSASVRVINPDFLTKAIRRNDEVVLTEQEIDLISRQLDLRCRDVDE